MISKSDRVKFLKKHHLFFGLSDPELDRVADVLRQKSVDQNSVISDQDTRMVGFYIIYRGRVRISGFSELSDQQYVVLSTRDYFGEIPISPYKPRSKAVEAIEDSLLFWFPPPTLMDLITNIPSFKANLKDLY